MHSRDRTLCVVGAGYVGLATAVGFATLGYCVDVYERDPGRRDKLRSGEPPVEEPGVRPLLSEALAEGRLRVIRGLEETLAEIVFVCVATPIDDAGQSDLGQVQAALGELAASARHAPTIVIRSTLPVGAGRRLAASGELDPARTFTNPEFLRQGSALQDFLHPSRIVIGRFPESAEVRLQGVVEVFAQIEAPRFVVDVTASELIKNAANAFLALRLSFVNELALLAEESGCDIGAVLPAIAADPRIGSAYLQPGFGFGGSCLPKELRTLTLAGWQRHLPMNVAAAASEANAIHRERFAMRLERLLGGVRERRIGLLGLAFKAGTDDVRESPALWLAARLLAAGARVCGYDPLAGPNAKRALPALEIASTIEDALSGADAAVIATELAELRTYDWTRARDLLRSPLVVDGRRLLDPHEVRRSGLRYVAVGSPDGSAAMGVADGP